MYDTRTRPPKPHTILDDVSKDDEELGMMWRTFAAADAIKSNISLLVSTALAVSCPPPSRATIKLSQCIVVGTAAVSNPADMHCKRAIWMGLEKFLAKTAISYLGCGILASYSLRAKGTVSFGGDGKESYRHPDGD
jgi:hypothetical protein